MLLFCDPVVALRKGDSYWPHPRPSRAPTKTRTSRMTFVIRACTVALNLKLPECRAVDARRRTRAQAYWLYVEHRGWRLAPPTGAQAAKLFVALRSGVMRTTSQARPSDSIPRITIAEMSIWRQEKP